MWTGFQGCFAAVSLMWATADAWAQGQLILNNRVINAVVAPIYGPESNNPFIAKQGNDPTGTPSGTEVYTGAPLAGTGYTAQLFGGQLSTPLEPLQPLLPGATFQTGVSAGFIMAPANAVTVPGVDVGQSAIIQLRVWDNRGGSITNWQQVMSDPAILRGQSKSFSSSPLGGLYQPPPNLMGLESFNLALGTPPTFSLRIAFESGLPLFKFPGVAGFRYQVLVSTNLSNWTVLSSVWPTNNLCEFRDPTAPFEPQKFYRVKTEAQ